MTAAIIFHWPCHSVISRNDVQDAGYRLTGGPEQLIYWRRLVMSRRELCSFLFKKAERLTQPINFLRAPTCCPSRLARRQTIGHVVTIKWTKINRFSIMTW